QLVQIARDLGAAEDATETLGEYIDSMQTVSGAGLAVVIGLVAALWAASNYVNAFSRAMNAIYEVEEGRPIWKLRPVMLALTVVIVALLLLVIVVLFLTGGLSRSVVSFVAAAITSITALNITITPLSLPALL